MQVNKNIEDKGSKESEDLDKEARSKDGEEEIKGSDKKEQRDFWKIVEEGTTLKLPVYLKNLLDFTGFNNEYSLRNFDSSKHIPELENFARDVMLQYVNQPSSFASKEDFFGPFSKCPNLFTISSGFKLMLEKVSLFCKSKQDRDDPNLKKETRKKKSFQANQAGAHQCHKDKLLATIKSSIQLFIGLKENEHSILMKPSVSLDSNDGEEVSSASVICAVCIAGDSTAKKVSKVTVYAHSGRWNIYNYRRHCKRFHVISDDKKNQNSSQRSILHMFPAGSKDYSLNSDPLSSLSSSSVHNLEEGAEDEDDDNVNSKRKRIRTHP